MISIASGVCFFLSVVSVAVWLYGLVHQHNALPLLRSTNIKELAAKKLLVVLGAISFFAFSLFWLLFIAAFATPLSVAIATSFFPYALVLDLLSMGAIAGLLFQHAKYSGN